MWIVLNDAYLSIVENENDASLLHVRARKAGDIETVFGDEAEVLHTPNNDYAYRADLPRATVAEAIANRLLAIDYPDFKSSVKDPERKAVYSDIWRVSHRLEQRVDHGGWYDVPQDQWDEYSDDEETVEIPAFTRQRAG